jgi:hypothetical protein
MAGSTQRVPRLEALLAAVAARPLRFALVAALLCLVLGCGFAVKAGSALPYPDEQEYFKLATNVARHGAYSYDGIHPTAYRPPGYPLFLSVLRATGLGVVGLRAVGALVLALSILLLYVLLRRIYGPRVTVLTCCVTAVYPLLLYTSTRLYPQALSLALLLGGLIAGHNALLAPSNRGRLLWATLAGLLVGAQLLTVPPVGVLLLAIALVVTVVRRSGVLIVALAIGVLLPLGWAVRNYEAMHAIVPISTNTGLNLLIGNSEHTTPSSGLQADVSRYMRYVKSHHLGEVQANTYYLHAAERWVGHHPLREAILYAGKVAYDFAPINQLHTAGEASSGTAIVSAVTYLPFLALFVLRLIAVAIRRSRLMPGELLLIAIVIGNALVQAINMSRVRYRVPTDPFMIAIGLALIGGLFRARVSVDNVAPVRRDRVGHASAPPATPAQTH